MDLTEIMRESMEAIAGDYQSCSYSRVKSAVRGRCAKGCKIILRK